MEPEKRTGLNQEKDPQLNQESLDSEKSDVFTCYF